MAVLAPVRLVDLGGELRAHVGGVEASQRGRRGAVRTRHSDRTLDASPEADRDLVPLIAACCGGAVRVIGRDLASDVAGDLGGGKAALRARAHRGPDLHPMHIGAQRSST